ncbi:hypothetical protein LTR84_002464 [Exophiala bonariae]|uniref:NACHT domain-containing protein n=1 Tax=Exophiala bonariae TaxID=1690606 RepID=A0AAV9N9V0_9EURO|nr:hypothetical protein LTR84_002464 [Exophiala bonariae]
MSFGFGVGDFIVVCDLVKKVRGRFVRAPAQAAALHDDDRHSSYKTSLNEEQRSRLDSISQGCQKTLQQLDDRLKDYQKADNIKGISGQARRALRRFDLDTGEAHQLRSLILAHLGFFNAFLAELNREVVAQFNSRHENQLLLEEQAKILDWLTPTDYAAQQNDIFSVHQNGTGQWLLESAEFQHVVSGGGKTLFLRGMPGAGKTLLMSNVIHHLQAKFMTEENIGIAYLYCNFRRNEEQTALHVCTNLLKQLVRVRGAIPESVKDMHSRHGKVQTRPTLEEIVTTLCAVIRELTKCIFIIDALDELDFKNARQLLPKMFEIQADTAMKLIASSREYPEICKSFAACDSLQIRATEDDITNFLEGHMYQLPNYVSKRPDLQDAVKSGIIEAADGMFLLVALHINSLIGKPSPKALKRTLEQLPKGLSSLDITYDKAMGRISSQLPEQYELAKQALSWITYAKRRLSALQLRHALAVEPGETSLDEDNLPDVDDIVSACAGLVVMDEESGIVRLVHYTTQDYFKRTKQRWFPYAEDNIAQACNTYLSFDDFKSGPCQQPNKMLHDLLPEDKDTLEDDYEDRLTRSPLFEYAALHWATHLNAVSSSFQSLVPAFIANAGQMSAIAQVRLSHDPRLSYRSSTYTIRNIIDRQAKDNIVHVEDSRSRTYNDVFKQTICANQMDVLHFAAWSGARHVVKALLDSRHRVDVTDWWGQTPLSWASQMGHDDIVKLLLEHGTNIHAADKQLRTALIHAILRGNQSTVMLLLDNGARVATIDHHKLSPLSYAVRMGTATFVSLLLAHGANPNGPDLKVKVPIASRHPLSASRHHITPLSIAAEWGDDEIVALLLARPEILVNLTGETGRTALSHAAGAGHPSTCTLLLSRADVQVDHADPWGRTPLSYAAQHGNAEVVNLLLQSCRGSINSRDSYGRTPLSYAAKVSTNGFVFHGHDSLSRSSAVMALLADDRVDPNTRDIQGRTPLSHASSGARKPISCDIVKQFLADERIDPDSRDDTGRTPLSWAADARSGLLFAADDGDDDVDGDDYSGAEVVELLLADERVDPNSQDSEGRTPLTWALMRSKNDISIPIVQALLGHERIDPMRQDKKGMTPLDHAAALCMKAAITALRPHYPQDYVVVNPISEVSSKRDDELEHRFAITDVS